MIICCDTCFIILEKKARQKKFSSFLAILQGALNLLFKVI